MQTEQKNVVEARLALTEKPLLATSAERFLIMDELKSQYRELSQPRRFAKLFSILLSRVSTPVEEWDLVAGRCVDRELTEEEELRFQAYQKHPDALRKTTFFSSGHCTYSWQMLLDCGLPGLRARVREELERRDDPEEREFLLSIDQVYVAITDYLLRYAEAARSRGMEELAANLQAAATEAPQSFVVALQLLWAIALIDCAYVTPNPTLTLGRLDQLLYPFYERDLREGRLTRERAAEYITDYYCKHNLIMGRGEHQVGDSSNSTTFERIYCFDAPQYLLLAGTDEDGASAVNDLTLLFAECIDPSFKNPVVVVRYFKGMDQTCPALWHTLMQKALKSASMMFYNDGNVISTYERIGLPPEDARKYEHFGCNWPSPGDNCAWMRGTPSSAKFNVFQSEEEKRDLTPPYMFMNAEHGWPEDLMIVLRELAERESAGEEISIEDVYTGFFARMSDFLDRKLANRTREIDARRRRPSAVLTLSDCFLSHTLQNAQSVSACSKYYFELQSFQMFATVADSFIVVDRLVFCEKRLTLRQLLDAVDANFEGYPQILALCRNTDRYGSNAPHANAHVRRLAKTATDLAIEKSRPTLASHGFFLASCMQSDTWHLKIGEQYGATPDGRLANTPFSQNTRPSNGAAKNGLTAMLNSMLQLPTDGLLSGALNLDVSPDQFEGEEGVARFGAILGSYFNRGGLHAQVSAVGREELLDAQKHPTEHRDLRVRVTGYSGVFVDICPRLQKDIIDRFTE